MTDTLKSICELCTHLHEPQLDFIPAEAARQKEIILQDLKALVSVASREEERAVILLACTLYEAILYCFIQAQADYIAARRESFTFNPDHDLRNYVNIFNRWFSDLLTIPDMIAEYRDMVHINRELKFPSDIRPRAAQEMLRSLDMLIGTLQDAFGK
jgi:hypothetical protein